MTDQQRIVREVCDFVDFQLELAQTNYLDYESNSDHKRILNEWNLIQATAYSVFRNLYRKDCDQQSDFKRFEYVLSLRSEDHHDNLFNPFREVLNHIEKLKQGEDE